MWILYIVLIVGFEVTADKIQLPNCKTIVRPWIGLSYFYGNITQLVISIYSKYFQDFTQHSYP